MAEVDPQNLFLGEREFHYHHSTEKAWCVSLDGRNTVWIPNAMLVLATITTAGMVKLMMPEWYMVKRGFQSDPRMEGVIDGQARTF